MNRADLAALVRVASNTPTSQLAHRARLMAKRRVLERLGNASPAGTGSTPPLAALPEPIFRPRRERVQERDGARWLDLAGTPYRLADSLEWHSRELLTGTRLELLNLHYMEWLEALGDDDFVRFVGDWIDSVRPYRRGYWLDSWNSYALSIRVVVWLQQLAVRKRLDAAFTSRVAGSVFEQVAFLLRNLEFDIEGNHLVKNAKALLWAGASFSGSEAAGWRRRGRALLDRILDTQILADGVHYELSASYHAQVLGDLLEVRRVLPDDPARSRLDDVLERMGAALGILTQPDGGPALFGDAGLHTAWSRSELEAAGARLAPAAPGPLSLRAAGFYGFRSSDDSYFLMKAGELGPRSLPAHSQADLLSFELSVFGRRFVVDPGVSMYHAGASRQRSRATASHNAVCLDGIDQCEIIGSFRVGRRCRARVSNWEAAADRAVLEASHDGYTRLPGRPTHVRRATIEPGRLAVEDRIDGGAGQVASVALLLHPAVEARALDDGGGYALSREGVTVRLSTEADTEVREAVWMPDFGAETPTREIVLRYGTAPTSAAFAFDW